MLGRPITVREDAALPLLPVRIDDGPIRWALLDIGSPVTVMRLDAPDRSVEVDAKVAILDSRSVLDDSSPDVTRMVFPSASLYDYAWDDAPLHTTTVVDGVLGGDLIGRFAIELHLSQGRESLTFYDTLAGQDAELSADGWAVFRDAFKGGGRTDAGCEPALSGRRPVVAACLYPTDGGPGIDASLALSTRVANLTVGKAASGRVPPTVGRIALVGDSEDLLGPCEEAANREESGRGAPTIRVDGAFAVEALADSDPALVAVRTEVDNAAPLIDGFLGTSFLRAVRARLDYPGDRLLLRCEDPIDDTPSPCTTLPRP